MTQLWLGVFLGFWIGAALAVGLGMIRRRHQWEKEFNLNADGIWKEPDRFWNPYSE